MLIKNKILKYGVNDTDNNKSYADMVNNTSIPIDKGNGK